MCPMGTGSVVPLGAGCVCGAGSVPSLPAVGLRDVATEGSSSSPSVLPMSRLVANRWQYQAVPLCCNPEVHSSPLPYFFGRQLLLSCY